MNNLKREKNSSNALTIFFVISFIWINIYPVCLQLYGDLVSGAGNLFDLNSPVFSDAILYIIVTSLISWIGVELILAVYRFILSFKIYKFILPEDKLKREIKTFFIYRNIYYGFFLNLCFLFPFMYSLSILIDVLITTLTFVMFASHIRKTYSESIVSHFVFSCFINPVIFYECLIVGIEFVEVIL